MKSGSKLFNYQGDVMMTDSQHLAMIFYGAFKRSNDVMFYCNKDAIIQDVNEAFVRLYGYARDEIIGQRPRILRSRHSTDELYRRMWTKILDPKIGFWRGDIINKAKDDREIPLILTITAVRDTDGEIIGFVSNAIDMTEHLALQHRVAQTEALAGLGEMAAVVAHEIRNPLGSIMMAAKQMAGHELNAEDRNTVLQVLRSESQRLNETLSNFLAYARPRELRLQRVDLNHLIQDVCHMVRSNQELAGNIHFSISVDSGISPFLLDPDQIRQVIWNIVLNALQAMEGRGELIITTRHSQGWVYLSIGDTGPGIPESGFHLIFKPFHTSKRQGTGLGLPIAERIVKAHGGRIEAKNRPEKGALFEVVLPWTEA